MITRGKLIINITKGIIVVLLLIALTTMPYGYYQVMRIVATGLFCLLGYIEWDQKHQLLSILCWISAAIFQPFDKIAFNKSQWHIMDLIFVGLLIIWIVADLLIKSKNTTLKV